MFLRGFGIGCALMTALWWWLRQKNNLRQPVLHPVQTQHIDRAAVERHAAQIIRNIQKEQSWILNPSVKPSTDL
jgi:hypothetical protein